MVAVAFVDALQALAIATAALLWSIEWWERRKERALSAFLHSVDDYLRYLELCIEHPSSRAFELDESISDPEARREVILFEFLFTICERAYVLYHGAIDGLRSRPLRRRRATQWSGWELWCERWCDDPGFRSAWTTLRNDTEYDSAFASWLGTLVREGEQRASSASATEA